MTELAVEPGDVFQYVLPWVLLCSRQAFHFTYFASSKEM